MLWFSSADNTEIDLLALLLFELLPTMLFVLLPLLLLCKLFLMLFFYFRCYLHCSLRFFLYCCRCCYVNSFFSYLKKKIVVVIRTVLFVFICNVNSVVVGIVTYVVMYVQYVNSSKFFFCIVTHIFIGTVSYVVIYTITFVVISSVVTWLWKLYSRKEWFWKILHFSCCAKLL